MKYVKILMALGVMCVLTMTAFSMPDNRMGPNDKQIPSDGQKPICPDGKWNPCDRPIKPMMGPDGKQICCGQKPIGLDGINIPGDGQMPPGPDGKQICHRPIKPMMGSDSPHIPHDGQMPTGPDDNHGPIH